MESDKVSEAWFPFAESTLANSGHLLGIHVGKDGLQNQALHYVSRDQGEVGWPVALWFLLPAHFED